ncbi:MAG: NADPH:quinone oxidoreductase family protein [Hyphomonadaceae bacterium]
MRALVCARLADDFSALGLEDRPDPVAGRGEVVVRIEAASLNFPDLLMLKGGYQFKPEPPFIPGMDFAGRVETVGEGVSDLKPGDRVAGGDKTGAFAQLKAVAAEGLSRIPDAMPFTAAAAYPAAYTTGHVALINRAGLKAGETLLVHGASGGVGMAAIDIGRLLGARVIAVTASPDKVPALKAAGADEALVIGDTLREQVLDLTGGRGVDVVFDPVGGDAFEISMRCLAFGGRLLVVGFAGGRVPDVKVNHILIKGVSVLGVRAGEYGRRFPEEGRKVRETIWRWAEEGRTRPVIHAEHPLEDWRSAFEAMRDRKLVGKVILRPGG